MIGPLLLLALGLGLAAAAAAVGVAAAAVSQAELTRWVAYRLRGAAAAARVLENPGHVIATANAATTLGVLLAAAVLPALLSRLPPTAVGLAVFFVGVPVFVSLAYLVPRVVGRRWAERLVTYAAPWVARAGRVLAPFVPTREPTPRTALAAVLASAETDALARADEIEVVSAVLAFADRPVRELMTPRTAIVAIPEGMLAAEAAHVFRQSGYSRYPVYRGSLDEIVGVAHAFDLLRVGPEDPIVVRPVLTVPGTTRAADLMLEMRRGRGHLAVVLDEFGGTAGLVTFEDLLRDLVAEIFGVPAQPPQAEAEGVGEGAGASEPPILELQGTAPATRLEEVFGIRLGGPRVETVGGLLVQALGRIPRPGERFWFRGLEFDVLAATATRVERVVVRRGPVRPVPLDRSEEHP
ncbi:MAG TPA: hemolysin family protein [Gemmatimonadales bacterium]|nr:hemolysin family protein [Gemmatimonadales bacterium]